ncbi:MAG: acyl-CoA dehydrogenase family protein [Burkholderiales bacterium]
MEQALSDTQVMVRDSLARFLADTYGFEARVRGLDKAAEQVPPYWRGMAGDLGILGASFPEAQGGLDGGPADNQVILEVLGSALAAEPYLSTVVIGGGLLRGATSPWADALRSRIIEGAAIVAFAHRAPGAREGQADEATTLTVAPGGWRLSGTKSLVFNAPWATHLAVTARNAATGGVAVAFIERSAPGITTRPYRTVDGGAAAELRFDDVVVPAEAVIGADADASALLQQVLDEATLGVCAEAIGVLERLLADTVAYTSQRKQFGVAIASFQALQHRMADMFIALEAARALTRETVASLGAAAPERARAVSSAKVAVSKACKVVGQGAIQLHGGMGMTEELAVGHYFRRATVIESLYGTVDFHLHRIAQLRA